MKYFSLNGVLFLTVPEAGSLKSGRQKGWVLDESLLLACRWLPLLVCLLMYLSPPPPQFSGNK